jgi:4-hydroxybenzoate polyprenyltransferase
MASVDRTAAASDIRSGTRIERIAPPALLPYLRLGRLDRPIGTWLLLFPCWWGTALAAGPGVGEHALLFVLFGFGSVVMRAAGCTINDIIDRDLDGAVARTRTRPIPSGAVGLKGAFAFLGLLLVLGLAIVLALPPFARWVAIASLPLVVTYPFMKRITWWPQLFLGITFNWGALVGYAAVAGSLGAPALLLYLAGIFWTLGYDTIYAHQDRNDDALIGIKSSARRLGSNTRPFLFAVYGIAALLFAASAYAAGLGMLFWLGLAATLAHLGWQAAVVDIDDPADCGAKFRANRFVGWLFLCGLIAEGLTR